MSVQPCYEPSCQDEVGAISLVIEPRSRDLGGFSVRRVLPSSKQRMVGPFIFFDHMGPAEFPPGEGIDVRPHPHIGLATVTYLFEGEIMHRDSLGFVQPIQSGAVNLMTAGRGIVHSERAGDDRAVASRLHGIQSWMALPADHEEIEPGFIHYPASSLPEFDLDGTKVRVIIGSANGETSPVISYSPMLYLEVRLSAGSEFVLPDDCEERAVYVVHGSIRIDGHTYEEGAMAVAASEKTVRLHSQADSRLMVIGGQPLGERHIWWNFVSSSKDRIENAKQNWKNSRFDPVPNETEFIPLPEK